MNSNIQYVTECRDKYLIFTVILYSLNIFTYFAPQDGAITPMLPSWEI